MIRITIEIDTLEQFPRLLDTAQVVALRELFDDVYSHLLDGELHGYIEDMDGAPEASFRVEEGLAGNAGTSHIDVTELARSIRECLTDLDPNDKRCDSDLCYPDCTIRRRAVVNDRPYPGQARNVNGWGPARLRSVYDPPSYAELRRTWSAEYLASLGIVP